MGRPRREIKVYVTWRTTNDPYAILPWVRATEILMRGNARLDARLAAEAEQDGNSMLSMTESLLLLANDLKDTILVTQARGVPFRVQRSCSGLAFILEKTQHTRPEPLSALTKVVERYEETKSLKPADYQDVTFNASYSLALLSLLLAGENRK